MIGGILSTAGGVVFAGEANGRFRAYDANNGNVLWSFNAGAGVNAPPSSSRLFRSGQRPRALKRRQRFVETATGKPAFLKPAPHP